MRCTSCSYENRNDARFCGGCGGELAATCSECGRPWAEGARFCDGCGRPAPSQNRPTGPLVAGEDPLASSPTRSAGPLLARSSNDSGAISGAERTPRSYTPRHLAERILKTRSALQGERKHVTVLFADVKGSVELAARVDPEEWHETLDRFFQIMADGVHRFEGTINQYTGDGVMALFGAPISHEDHALRACHAAEGLASELRAYTQTLRRERGFDFAVRIGIHSGDVVVGRIGDDLRMDYTAQGATVGLAARLQQIAEGGRVYVSDDTASIAAGYFDFEDLGEFQLKGIDEPARVHALRGTGPLRSRLEVSAARGFSRFVGRDTELRWLEESLERSARGDACSASVVAEAGTGKSRLCLEFASSCRTRGVRTHTAQAISFGSAVPLRPVFDLLEALFGIEGGDTADVRRQKIAGSLALLGASAATPLTFEALGVANAEDASTDLALGFLWIGPPDQVRISWPTLLGYTPLVLLALGFRGVRRQPIWLLLAAAALLLSLGPSLYLGGRDTGVPLPSAWLADVPILFMLRKPDRFVIVMQLALAILSAFAWRDLSSRTSDARIQWGLWILILALAGAELRGSPLPMSQRPAAEFATAVERLVDTAEGQNLRTIAVYGTNPSYVDLMQRTFNRADEKALLASLSYDFSGLGWDGLSAIVNFAAGFDGKLLGVRGNAQEVDLTIDYKIEQGWLESFWLRLRGSWVNEEQRDRDGSDFRLILRYDIPVI